MNILDIAIAKKLAAGGGGSGTDNYNDLSNLPKINDTTLSGNKSSSALGLQSEINSDSKLASDLVDDTNQDNKFVTSTEKNTWNAKQNAIDSDHKLSSDLVDDANHTNKFVTSTEKNTWNAKQNAIDSEHKLSSSLVSFTDAEAAALASGIDSSKVGQISTNQTNILSVKDMACDDTFSTSKSYAVGDITIYDNKLYKFKNAHQGAWSASDVDQISLSQLEQQDRNALVEQVDEGAKNKLLLDKDAIKSLNSGGTWSGYVYTPTTAPNLTVTINDDGTVTLNGSTSSSLVTIALERKASSGFQGYVLSGSKANTKLVYQLAVSPYTVYATADGVGSAIIANYTDGSTIQLSLQIVANSTFSNTIITPMICTKADWDISPDYVEYALPNSDLTQLEQQDRNALVEVVDKGAKNEFEFGNFTPGGETVSATISDYSVTVTGASSWAKAWRTFRVTKSTAYVLSFRVTNVATVANPQYRVSLGNNYHSGGSYYGIISCDTTGNYDMIFTPPADTDIYLIINPNYTSTAASDTPSITVDNIMICSQADWKVSHAFAPYRKNLDQLDATKVPMLSGSITSGDLNDVTINTFAMYANTVSSLPTSENYYVETSVFDANSLLQRAYNIATAESYVRVKCVGSWSAWKQITNA